MRGTARARASRSDDGGMRSKRRDRHVRFVVAAIALTLLGPGRPFVLTAMTDAPTDDGPAVGDVRRSTETAGSWTVRVDLADEVSGSVRAPAADPPSTSKRHALIVGINNARGGDPLPGSVTDAKNLRRALLMYGFKDENIRMLVESSATRDAIRREIDSLAARTPTNGIAVFAVATHTRRYGGQNELLTADGLRISAAELAARLGAVRSRMWVALPTCYSAGYAKPGIVGPNRVATFASAADRKSYQLGDAGSFLILNMVRRAMIERQAPSSVEQAFHWAKNELERSSPEHVPNMRDGIDGDLVLGRIDAADPPATRTMDAGPPPREGPRYAPERRSTVRSRPPEAHEPPAEGSAGTDASGGSSNGGIGICGTYQARCGH